MICGGKGPNNGITIVTETQEQPIFNIFKILSLEFIERKRYFSNRRRKKYTLHLAMLQSKTILPMVIL